MDALQAAFRDAVTLYLARRVGAPEPLAALDGKEMSMAQLTRIAAGLHQTLPGNVCIELQLPAGSSYSRGARRLRELIERDRRAAERSEGGSEP
jgi:hypothetical protein